MPFEGGQHLIDGYAGAVPGPPYDPRSTREWWLKILGIYGKYPCCAFLLVLPEDNDVVNYFRTATQEVDLLSGEACLVLFLGNESIEEISRTSGGSTEFWTELMDRHLSSGYSLSVAEYFGIGSAEFPCLVFFRDIRTPEHIVLSLKGISRADLVPKMRRLFDAIRSAVKEKRDPLTAIGDFATKEVARKRGKKVIHRIQNLVGKTFETALAAYVIGSTSGPS